MCPPYLLSVLGVLTVTGCVGALNISAAQPQVTGYEHDSIVLKVSYQISNTTNWLQIRWNMVHPNPLHLIICTIRSESPSRHSMFPENGYEGRMTIDPESGSLVIKHLKVEDSGTYKVSILNTELEMWTLINVTVLPARTDSCGGALTISAAQPQVTGYEHDSIVLKVFYQISNTTNCLQIRWNMVHTNPLHLIICTIRSEIPSRHSMFPENGYEGRMTIDPESGSLVIKHLKVEDSGTYKVSILNTELEMWTLINVTVLPARTDKKLSTIGRKFSMEEQKRLLYLMSETSRRLRNPSGCGCQRRYYQVLEMGTEGNVGRFRCLYLFILLDCSASGSR